jgi:APA family basic amino acid/polyamine antiporter
LPRPYRTLGYPVTPLLFVALMSWMMARAVLSRPGVALAGGATVLAGLALWWVLERRNA